MSKFSKFSILFIGDVHFKVTNIPEVDLFIKKITELAEERKPDLIIIAGDVLDTHERLHTIPLNKSYDFINAMRNITLTYVLVGNHDYINNQQFLTTNHWMNGMKDWENIIIVDKVLVEKVGDYQFTFVPYVAPGRFEEALNTVEENVFWEDSNCIFAHQEFFGCKMGAIVSVEGDRWPLDKPYVVSGHIHSRQQPQENVYYSGSAMQHAFGESTKNTVVMLVFSDVYKKYEIEEIDLELPRKKIVYIDVENVDEYELPETCDQIKLTVSGGYDQFKALKKTKKYKKLIDDGVKIVFKAKKVDIKEEYENISENIANATEFTTILNDIVNQSKDSYLYETYELVVNNNQVKNDDVLYI